MNYRHEEAGEPCITISLRFLSPYLFDSSHAFAEGGMEGR